MAYGLGRNIALLQTSLQSFKPPSKRIKQKNSQLTIILKSIIKRNTTFSYNSVIIQDQASCLI